MSDDALKPRTEGAGMASRDSSRKVFTRRAVHGLRRNPVVLLALVVVVALPIIALTAPWIAPYDPSAQVLMLRFEPPSWDLTEHGRFVFGTDHLGRDVLSRAIHGTRISVMVGLAATLLSGTIGVLVGLCAGFFGRWVDQLLMRLADIQLAFPTLLLLLAVAAVIGPGLWNVVILLGVSGWVTYARVIRADVLSLKSREFVIAARIGGARRARLVFRHILPNVVAPLVTIATLQVPMVIMLEAALSFLGLGTPAAIPTWGRMLNDAHDYMEFAWWMALIPGIALVITTLSINLLGDFIRDVTDVKTRV